MIVFNIPSWYPSETNPIYGTFIREQILMMARNRPDSHFVVSRWGQGQEEMLLWSKKPAQSIRKLTFSHSRQESALETNVVEYFTPAFTWTRKFFKGNINGIIRANENNFKKTIEQIGKPDIIHCQAAYPAALVGRFLSQKYRVPFVVTIRMSPFPFQEFLDKSGNIKPIIRRPLAAAGSLIATSSSLGHQLRKFEFTNVTVCNNPVDVDFFRPCINRSDQKKLIAVGRLVEQKGFDLLLKAMHGLDPSITLTIIGDGVEKDKLKALQQRLGLDVRVAFLGEMSRSETRDKICQHDALILSSRHETFGNVLVEALACGVPVVATDCGGPADIITEDVGVLCEKDNADALRAAVEKVLNQDWDSEKIRNYAVDKFSPHYFTNNMFKIYEAALKNFNSNQNNLT